MKVIDQSRLVNFVPESATMCHCVPDCAKKGIIGSLSLFFYPPHEQFPSPHYFSNNSERAEGRKSIPSPSLPHAFSRFVGGSIPLKGESIPQRGANGG